MNQIPEARRGCSTQIGGVINQDSTLIKVVNIGPPIQKDILACLACHNSPLWNHLRTACSRRCRDVLPQSIWLNPIPVLIFFLGFHSTVDVGGGESFLSPKCLWHLTPKCCYMKETWITNNLVPCPYITPHSCHVFVNFDLLLHPNINLALPSQQPVTNRMGTDFWDLVPLKSEN